MKNLRSLILKITRKNLKRAENISTKTEKGIKIQKKRKENIDVEKVQILIVKTEEDVEEIFQVEVEAEVIKEEKEVVITKVEATIEKNNIEQEDIIHHLVPKKK